MNSLGERTLFNFAVHSTGNFVAILLVAIVLDPHVRLPPAGSAEYWATAVIFAITLSFLNHYIRPLLYLLLAPLACLLMIFTLGLAHFLTGALMFWLAGELFDSIYVESFGYALLGALVTALIGQLVASLMLARKGGRGPRPPLG